MLQRILTFLLILQLAVSQVMAAVQTAPLNETNERYFSNTTFNALTVLIYDVGLGTELAEFGIGGAAERNQVRIEGITYIPSNPGAVPAAIVAGIKADLTEAARLFEAGDFEAASRIMGRMQTGAYSALAKVGGRGANRIVPDQILDQAGLNRFANLRNDLGITSNNQLRRNVAVGEDNVDGVDIGEIIGVSGRRGPGVELPENPIFTTTTVGHPRNLDSEVFVLENLAQRLTPQSTGTIRLLSERTVCGSCQGVITQFREMFPNINLIVRAGSQ